MMRNKEIYLEDLTDSEQTKLKSVVRGFKRKYSANTARQYSFLANNYLKKAALQFRKKQADPEKVALSFLKDVQVKKSRSYFLQACRVVSAIHKGFEKPLDNRAVTKLQRTSK